MGSIDKIAEPYKPEGGYQLVPPGFALDWHLTKILFCKVIMYTVNTHPVNIIKITCQVEGDWGNWPSSSPIKLCYCFMFPNLSFPHRHYFVSSFSYRLGKIFDMFFSYFHSRQLSFFQSNLLDVEILSFFQYWPEWHYQYHSYLN